MTPAVVAQDGVMAGKVALDGKKQAMVLGVGAGVGLLDIGVILPRGGVVQVGRAPLVGVGSAGCRPARAKRGPYGLVDINRAQDMPARVAHVVRFDHPVAGNLPLVTEVPHHHASDRQVPGNGDIGPLRREDRVAGERIAHLAGRGVDVSRERVGELAAAQQDGRDIRRVGGPALGIEQHGGIVIVIERRANGLFAVAFRIPYQAEPGRERGPMRCRERFAVRILRRIRREDQAGRRAGISRAVPVLREQVPVELVAAPELVVCRHGGLPTHANVDAEVRCDVDGILQVSRQHRLAQVIGNHVPIRQLRKTPDQQVRQPIAGGLAIEGEHAVGLLVVERVELVLAAIESETDLVFALDDGEIVRDLVGVDVEIRKGAATATDSESAARVIGHVEVRKVLRVEEHVYAQVRRTG